MSRVYNAKTKEEYWLSEFVLDVYVMIFSKFVDRAVKGGWKDELNEASDELAKEIAKKAEKKTCKDVSGCKDHTRFVCSNCGSTWFFCESFYFDYCPSCGAEVEQEEEE